MSLAKDQVVAITGGASGLGRALVERFLAEGAAGVVVLDKSQPKLQSLADEYAPVVAVVHGDVTNLSDNQRLVSLALERFGHLDTFIGNAGIFDYAMPLVDIPEAKLDEAFHEVFAVNVKGYILGAKAAMGALVRARGSIVLTLSPSSVHAGTGGILYTASKHAGLGLVRQLAHELAPHVRVNGVAPGLMSTDLRGPGALGLDEQTLSNALPPTAVIQDTTPLTCAFDARAATGPYLFLSSRTEGQLLTGVVVHADGGIAVRGMAQAAGGQGLAARFR